jgi:hypothetical protein
MNKNARKLIPAVAMLLVSASMLSTASYAWFSMNSKVTATGMEVNVAAPASIMIAPENAGATGPDTAKYNTTVAFSGNKGTLGHASSTNGVSFWATNPNNIDDKGDVNKDISMIDVSKNNDATATTKYSEVYEVDNTNAYVDFSFYLATSSTATVNVTLDPAATKIVMTKEDGDVNNDALLPAMRFAVLTATATDGTYGALTALAKNIWAGYDNAKVTEEAYTTATTKAAINQLEKTVNTNAEVEGPDEYPVLMTLAAKEAASSTGYGVATKVVIRVWLEGEDDATLNANILTLKNFKIEVGFMKAGTPVA